MKLADRLNTEKKDNTDIFTYSQKYVCYKSMSNVTKVGKNTLYLLKSWWKQTLSSVDALTPVHLTQTFPFVNTQLARFQ